MTDLKPCPFCGGDAKKTPRFLMGYNGDGVICSKCSIETPKHITDQRAFDLWNKRTSINEARKQTVLNCDFNS